MPRTLLRIQDYYYYYYTVHVFLLIFVCLFFAVAVCVRDITDNESCGVSVKDRRTWRRRGISGNSGKKRNKNEKKRLKSCPAFQSGMFSIGELNAMYSILVTCFFWLNLLCDTGNTRYYYNNVSQNYFSVQNQTSTEEKKKHKRMNKQTKKQAKKKQPKSREINFSLFPSEPLSHRFSCFQGNLSVQVLSQEEKLTEIPFLKII